PAGGAAAPPPVPAPAPTKAALDEFVAAYENARFYHGTGTKEKARSIHEQGLLNYADRKRVLGGDVVGMSQQMASAYGGDEQKGVYLGPRRFMEEETATIPQNLVRLFLPYSRTERVLNPNEYYSAAPEDLVRDINFPGGLISKQSIPAGQIYFGEMSKADDERLASILQSVATHYPEDRQPSLEEMTVLPAKAITKPRSPDVPLYIRGR